MQTATISYNVAGPKGAAQQITHIKSAIRTLQLHQTCIIFRRLIVCRTNEPQFNDCNILSSQCCLQLNN